MAKISKKDVDLNSLVVQLRFLFKGFRQELTIHTTAKESCDFVDWCNTNPAIKSYSRIEKEKFENKFYHFDDYMKRETVSVNLSEIKYFSIPWFVDDGESYEVKVMTIG